MDMQPMLSMPRRRLRLLSDLLSCCISPRFHCVSLALYSLHKNVQILAGINNPSSPTSSQPALGGQEGN